jgi:hypothetical protein
MDHAVVGGGDGSTETVVNPRDPICCINQGPWYYMKIQAA